MGVQITTLFTVCLLQIRGPEALRAQQAKCVQKRLMELSHCCQISQA